MKDLLLRAASIAILLGGYGATCAHANSYSDGFEASTINPFWSQYGPGTATLTTAPVHSGAQALELAQSSIYPYNVGMLHDFGAQVTGSVSIWVYNGGTPNASLGVSMDANGVNQAFIEWHQDNIGSPITYCGPYTNGCFQARVVVNGVEQFPRPLLPATPGWHQFELVVGSSGVVMKVDGAIFAANSAITTFHFTAVDNWGSFCAGCAPNTTGIAYFDDFTADWTLPCQPPSITQLTASPTTLWPPNHKMVPVAISAATSGGCGAVSCKITSVTSNEPVDADGDWIITGPLTLNLRAERNGLGTGRVYTITVQCTDASGNGTTKTVPVTVAHDQGH